MNKASDIEVIIKVSDDRHAEDDPIIFLPLQGENTVQCHWEGGIFHKMRETECPQGLQIHLHVSTSLALLTVAN